MVSLIPPVVPFPPSIVRVSQPSRARRAAARAAQVLQGVAAVASRDGLRRLGVEGEEVTTWGPKKL